MTHRPKLTQRDDVMSRIYEVKIDEQEKITVMAESLAEVCNKVRGKGSRIRIWSPSGYELIDTTFVDVYRLNKPKPK